MKEEWKIPPAPDGARPDAVVFDVDGTLYRQRGLRRRMLIDLLKSAILTTQGRRDLRILKQFREDREILSSRVSSGFAEAQYRVTADALGSTPECVEQAVDRWIHRHPLRYLLKYRTAGIAEWIEFLRGEGVRLGVYSEYPAADKVKALGLEVDAIACSTDPEVDAFKPDPKGLLVVLQRLGVEPSRALYVGDRDDRDRPCAEAAGTAYLPVENF